MKLLMSFKYPELSRALCEKGFDIIPTMKINAFHKPEQLHADMQVLRLNNQIFTLRECDYGFENEIKCAQPAGKDYPGNVLLNLLFFNNKLYGKISSADETVKNYCLRYNIKLVNINQGYARCSALVLNESAVITADKSIEKALINNGAEVLLIAPGNIALDGFDYGFIGGASAVIGKTVFFFGNVKKHPDFKKINEFIKNHNFNMEVLCDNLPLTDIGGAVIV